MNELAVLKNSLFECQAHGFGSATAFGVRGGIVVGVTGVAIAADFGVGYPRSGVCSGYDRRFTSALADKVMDLLLREEYGQMPVLRQMVTADYLEEYNISSVDMGSIGNQPLQQIYYNESNFTFTDAYVDFLKHILGKM